MLDFIEAFPKKQPAQIYPLGEYSGTGNRCGHDPETLRVVPFKAADKRPIIIQKLLKATGKFYKRPRGSKKPHHELILTRSEGRESLIQFLQKLIYNLELSTMTVCLNDITFRKPTLKEMTQDFGETGLSYSRAKRAEKKLIAMGYLKVVRSPKYVNGEFRADPSVREITPKAFRVLGLERDYAFQKHYKLKRLEKKGSGIGLSHELVSKVREWCSLHRKGEENGEKASSFHETRQYRQKLISLYIDLFQKKSPDIEWWQFKAVAEKMTTEGLKQALEYFGVNTS